MAFYYDADDYFYCFNRENYPEHEIDDEPESTLTYEQRKQRWHERRWLNEPEVVADDWLFAPLPSSECDEF